jgi:hypothetical protein
VRGKLGDEHELHSLASVKDAIAERMTSMLESHIAEAETAYQKQAATLAFRKSQIVDRQRRARADLETAHRKRFDSETAQRASLLNKGFRGIWDRIIGKYSRQMRENERAALDSTNRDRREKDSLIDRHIDERRSFHQIEKQLCAVHGKEIERLHKDIAAVLQLGKTDRTACREEFRSVERDTERPRRTSRKKDRDPDRGPEH